MSSILVSCRNKTSAVHHYVPAIKAAGWHGPIQLVTPGDPLPALDSVAALLLTWGGDIHPRAWDAAESIHPKAEVDEERDQLEIPLTRAAWEQDLPILGICRGHQILNVALGGSMIQDVPEHFACPPHLHQHGTSEHPEVRHTVAVTHGSRLASLMGGHKIEVNSRHHQAVARVAEPLQAVAFHPETFRDGLALVEGIEARDPQKWALGVQWHPENLAEMEGFPGDAARGIFSGFVQAALDKASQD